MGMVNVPVAATFAGPFPLMVANKVLARIAIFGPPPLVF
jgi:hypothetical protein